MKKANRRNPVAKQLRHFKQKVVKNKKHMTGKISELLEIVEGVLRVVSLLC